MKPSNRRKRQKIAQRKTKTLLQGRYRRYSCACGHHNMAERSWWERFLYTPEGQKWLTDQEKGYPSGD